MKTSGWDTVFLCSLNRVNESLAANLTRHITTFSYDENDIQLSGEFGAWSLVRGGSNKLLHFETPIKKGELKALGNSYDLSGVIPEMQLQLAFIDNASTADVKDLKFDFKVAGSKPGDSTPGAVTTITPDVGDRLKEIDPTGIVGGILADLLPKCLIANKDKLSHVFASINLIPPDSASWLAPKRVDYLYAEPVTGKVGWLALLSVVTDRDVSNLGRNIDPAILSGDQELCFAISQEMFMRHVLMPGLPAAYGHGAKAGNFVYAGGTITNHGKLKCGTVTKYDIDFHPHLDHLAIKVAGASLKTSAKGSFPIPVLYDAHVNFTLGSTNKCIYDPAKKSISFSKDAHPSHHYDPKIPIWEAIPLFLTDEVIAIILILIIAYITDCIASAVTKALNKGGNLTIAKMAPITFKWEGLENFDVQDAGLSGAFYVRGKYGE